MSEEDGDATLSITLVDGISCGLAGALLLFVIFGVNLSASTSTLGGQSGQGTVTRFPSGLTKEPVDIVIEVEGVVGGDSTPWQSPSDTDTVVVDAEGQRTVFIRQLEDGFKHIDGVQVRRDDINFNLDWVASSPPEGVVHIFRSGTRDSRPFVCQQRKGPYAIITGYELLTGVMEGSCFE